MGLDIYFIRHKNTNYMLEKNFAKFFNELDNTMPQYDAHELAKKYGVADRLSFVENHYDDKGEQKTYLQVRRTDTDDAMYFRKHNWLLPFFEYGDNCSYKQITKTDLERLIATIEEIFAAEDKETKAAELLLCQSEFFFGGTDYDEYYFDDLENELNQCKKAIEETDWNKDIMTMYCWW